jgi:5-methylcytosine-specific restriction enzyme subunit McrC
VQYIPIQNIYYLLCYAWNKLEEGEVVNVEAIPNTQLVDLFAKVLLGGTHHLIRRGFDRGYLSFIDEGARVKGKIDFSTSFKKNLFLRGKSQYRYDELNYNVFHNQILKTTIARLIHIEGLSQDLKDGLVEILRRLREVSTVPLSSGSFRRVQLHRNNHYYSFLLNICEYTGK